MVATITLSLEIELGWGFHDKSYGTELFSEQCTVEHRTLDRLLDVCDRTGVPISFDIVGFLLNSPGYGAEPSPHSGDWWPSEIGGTSEDPLYYAPSVVDRIRSASVDHEICTHTYTHIPCAEFSDEILNWELERASEIHQDHSLQPPTSIVPPRHSPPSRAILDQNGIDCVRVAAVEPPESNISSFTYYLTRSHPIQKPEMVNNVLETYTSMNTSLTAPYLQNGQKSPHPAFRMIPRRVRKRIHRRYLSQAIERAVEKDSYTHLWSHLFNISNDIQFPIVTEFLTELEERQRRGEIEISKMTDLVDTVTN
ncbi:polysaccharide deacetylase [Halorubrum sp. SS5]|nr:polysaccharide deacetylase [Halorubrum sp. SS5]